MDEKARRPRKKTGKSFRKITESYLHNAGLYYLQRFAASREGFREVMLRKVRKSCAAHPDQDVRACENMVDALVDRFERSGLLNDGAYAESMAASLRRAGKSRRAILRKMTARGLDPDLSRNALEQEDAGTGGGFPEAEAKAARAFVRKKKLGIDKGQAKMKKDLASMARAGFSYDAAKRALEYADEE